MRDRPGRRGAVLIGLVAAVATLLVGTGCGSHATSGPAGEQNPAGDIPDNIAFVAFRPASGGFEVKVPEGWSRTDSGSAVVFTDKLNSVRIEAQPAAAAPTVDTAKATEVPTVAAGTANFVLGKVEQVHRSAGDAVLVTFRADSPPDPVTGKVIRNSVERYEFFHNGTSVVLTLSGPEGADNVDPWRTVTDSLRWLS